MTETSISYGTVLGELGICEEDVRASEQIFCEAPQVRAALTDPRVKKSAKHAVIERVFPASMHNFLKVMCDYHYIEKEKEVFEAYHDYKNKKQGILCAELYCVTKPSDAQAERIKAFLCREYGCKSAELAVHSAPELIGGFIIRVGSREYDWSIRGRMQQLKTKMIRR